MVEIEWQFDALDLRPVERWLAALPTLSIPSAPSEEQQTVTALAKTPRRLSDSYLDTDDWRLGRAGWSVGYEPQAEVVHAQGENIASAHGNALKALLQFPDR